MGWGGDGKGWGGWGKGGYGYGMMPPMWGMMPPWAMKGMMGKGKGKGKGKQLKVDDSLKVWIGNLSAGITWKQLQEHVNQAGPSKWVEVFEGKGKGTACVVYKTAEEAMNAIKLLNGSLLGGGAIQADVWEKTQVM